MTVWTIMLLTSLILPASMIGFGGHFARTVPGEINWVFGYRTTMSMKNAETWLFAHRYFGRLWFLTGLALLPVTAAAMLFALGRPEETAALFGTILMIAQCVVMLVPIVPTEIALHRRFDRQGNRRETPPSNG